MMISIDKMPKNLVVIDLEIKTHIDKQEDWNLTDKIEPSCICLYLYNKQRYRVFGPHEIESVKAFLENSDCIIGYNITLFDIPIIYKCPNKQLPRNYGIPLYDIQHKIWKAVGIDPYHPEAHKGYSLDNIATFTLGKCKLGHSGKMQSLYESGNIWRIADHCLNDVALTKELYDHVQETGFISSKERGIIVIEDDIYKKWYDKQMKAAMSEHSFPEPKKEI